MRRTIVCVFSIGMSVAPAFAQLQGIGGSDDFRAPDRPISAPTLRFPESAGLSDAQKFDAVIGPRSADDVLKQLDKELGRTGTKSTDESDSSRAGEPSKPGERLDTHLPTHGTIR